MIYHFLSLNKYRTPEFKRYERLAPKMSRILIANLASDKIKNNAVPAMYGLRTLASYENPAAMKNLTKALDAKDHQKRLRAWVKEAGAQVFIWPGADHHLLQQGHLKVKDAQALWKQVGLALAKSPSS